jgi:spore coat polysaccharide biosynthesis protein SpsF (cytidylyltransferase family)
LTTVLIGVRIGSSRLPAKCLLPLCGGMSILKHVISRCKAAGLTPVVCTILEDLGIIENHLNDTTTIITGPLENKLKRLFHACDQLGLSEFHSLDADDPYFCPIQIRKSMYLLQANTVVFPSVFSDKGGATEGYSFRKSALQNFFNTHDSINTTYFPHHFDKIDYVRAPSVSYEGEQTRLTLDYIEDYRYVYEISKLFKFSADRAQIENYINENSFFDNAFLNEEWKKRQIRGE